MTTHLKSTPKVTRISLVVKPGTSQEKIVPSPEDASVCIVYLRAKAVDGAANTALIKLLSKQFRVPKTSIKILRGATSRHKLIELPL